MLDFFSLASLLPLILVVVNPGFIQTDSTMLNIYQGLGMGSQVSMGIVLTVAVLMFFVLKTWINHWITYRKASYAYGVGSELASAAISQYFTLPYQKFASVDFAKELHRLSNVPLMFSNNIIIPAGTLLSEFLVLVILSVAIAWYQFNVFLLLFIILVPAYFIYQRKRKQASLISGSIALIYPRLLKYTLEIVEGLIDIRSFHKQNYFKQRFEQSHQGLGKIFAREHTSQTDIARTTELVAVFCVCLILGYSLLSRQNEQDTPLLLGIYAAVSFRLIPSINRIFAALQQIRTNSHVVDELLGLRDAEDRHADQRSTIYNAQAPAFLSSILLDNVTFSYPNGPGILQATTLEIIKGEMIAITGQSGEGKTTLFLILLGLLEPDTGKVLLDGIPRDDEKTGPWRKLFGYVPQQPYLLDATIAENVAFGMDKHDIQVEKIIRLLDQMELGAWIGTLPEGIYTRVGEKGLQISGGQRQRLAIARGLYHDCEILLLDEVTNQLDSNTEAEIFESLKKVAAGKTVMMITHHPDLLIQFERVYELVDGGLREITHSNLSSHP